MLGKGEAVKSHLKKKGAQLPSVISHSISCAGEISASYLLLCSLRFCDFGVKDVYGTHKICKTIICRIIQTAA